MNTKALIFDLDNTVYPVASIADKLFPPLLQLIADSGEQDGSLDQIKQDLMRKPLHDVAKKYGFSKALTEKGTRWLENVTYDGPIDPFPDFSFVQSLPGRKILVTAGYPKLQHSKIQGLKLEKVFDEIHVVDVEKSSKKEMFAEILKRHDYQPDEVLVVGDDTDSEIKAALELSARPVLYDKINLSPDYNACPRITDFKELDQFIS